MDVPYESTTTVLVHICQNTWIILACCVVGALCYCSTEEMWCILFYAVPASSQLDYVQSARDRLN